jgi:hypothetical protein
LNKLGFRAKKIEPLEFDEHDVIEGANYRKKDTGYGCILF